MLRDPHIDDSGLRPPEYRTPAVDNSGPLSCEMAVSRQL